MRRARLSTSPDVCDAPFSLLYNTPVLKDGMILTCPVLGYLGLFAIIINVAVNSLVATSLPPSTFIFEDKFLAVELLG